MLVESKPKNPNWKVLAAEIFSGVLTGFIVSPLNTIVDKAVIEFTNKKEPSIWKGAAKTTKLLLKHPFSFLSSFEFKWMCFVYFPTYATSNLADHFNLSDQLPHPLQKLSAIFLVNTSASLIKDRVYTIRLNPFKASEPFPVTSLLCFFLRDLIAMAAAFTLPPICADLLSRKGNIEYKTAERVAQLSCPILVLLVGTPVHLLGLGLYN